MKTPSVVGETAAVIAVLDFVYWAAAKTPGWAGFLWAVFGVIFIIDWMRGGVTDVGIMKSLQK